jgi:aminopeptidase YwaD
MKQIPCANIMAHLHHLCVTIGPRPSGSQANRAAADYIRNVFERCDLEVETQPFAVPAWQTKYTQLDIAGKSVLAAANTFSPACNIRAEVVPLCSLEEVAAANISGRMALLYGDVVRNPLPAKSWMFKDEREAHLVELLEAKRPMAILTVQNRPGWLERLIEDWEFDLPSATIPAEVGLQLLQTPHLEVHLRIESERHPGQTTNIIGRRQGARPERIVLCAHYDTKVDTPGAGDNGGGVSTLLALAECLSEAPVDCGLEFVAFTNEEYLPLGDDEYVRLSESYFGSILAALNFDGVGLALGTNTLTALSCSADFEAHIRHLQRAEPGMVWVPPWPESNHSTFAFRGVPSLAFSNTASTLQAHLRADTVEWLSAAKLSEVVRVAEAVVHSLQAQSLNWVRAQSPVPRAED